MNAKLEKLEIIKVGGDAYLGVLVKDEKGNIAIENAGSLDSVQYIQEDLLGELVTIEVENHASISHRKLKKDDVKKFETMLYILERAKETAVEKLILKEFKTLLQG